ncbi:MAG: dephospho-CoA kinase [Deltaproteobacteria bacterium]|nr:dephospho-CoA kinase [Deltaproteobacteria bacterium]
MLLVGLTGGIASGKSTVSRMLQERGAVVVDADRIAREVVAPGSPAFAAIVAAFGHDVVSDDGALDRRRLGEIVFADPARRRDLEAIVHPQIIGAIRRQVREIQARTPDALVVIDGALLIEAGFHREVDVVVLVSASRAHQMERLIQRDGLSPAEAAQRLDAQLPLEEKARYAHFVVSTDSSLEETARQVDRVMAALGARKGGRRGGSGRPEGAGPEGQRGEK